MPFKRHKRHDCILLEEVCGTIDGVVEALRESWGGTLVAVREDRHVLAVEGFSDVRVLHEFRRKCV